MISQNLRPSTVADEDDTCLVNDYRTSKTADLNYFLDPFYLSIDKKIAKFNGFRTIFWRNNAGSKV